MEIFAPVIQGSYAYILVFQLLIVTALFLTLVYLVVQRVRTAPIYRDIGAPAAHVETIIREVQVAAPAPVENAEAKADFEELQARFAVMEQEYLQLKNGNQDTRALQEKIKFLESKLLEYEILQEEISTLGTLKLENEKLRTDLVKLERDVASLGGVPAVPAIVKGVEPSTMHDPDQKDETKPPETAQLEGLLEKIDDLAKKV